MTSRAVTVARDTWQFRRELRIDRDTASPALSPLLAVLNDEIVDINGLPLRVCPSEQAPTPSIISFAQAGFTDVVEYSSHQLNIGPRRGTSCR
jgi:hypothetical protein